LEVFVQVAAGVRFLGLVSVGIQNRVWDFA